MRVKICGITKLDQGIAIARLGAQALGFICVPASPRYVSPETIRLIVEQLPENVDRIGVFANTTIENICQVAAESNLSGVQLHGDETAEYCDRLREFLPGIEIIKALRVKTPETLATAAVYAVRVDTLLLDAYHPGQLGGTGKTIDWMMLSEFRPPCPWLLAGGLTPDNILNAIDSAICNNFSGVDLSSGVEIAPGDKDLTKVTQLFAKLSQLANH
ncbi:phosphoribosylanthranilate isomerase [Microcoleus sp. BR0-C5]|uniref:phosphoribosylanthranilate isomerase n=1 Tax=Microcoleus sp. BR0-C5 TaxID=2818713 RepID=UPI002FD09DA2